jgi:Ca-activated chloride channel family protein
MIGKLGLTATWNHDPLPALDQPSLAYLLIDIAEEGVSGESPKTTAPASSLLNLSLVLDTSGSMSGAKLQNLKQAVAWVIDHLSARDTIAITLFDDEVHPLVPSTKVTDPNALREQVEAISEMGGTAMSKGLLIGLDEAMKGQSAEAVSRIVVLTDGQTWGDADRCRQLAAQAGAAGIPVTALGVGAEEDWSIELLDAIASESGGVSGYIARPEEISQAFEQTLRAMQATVYRNLRLAGGVSARTAYRVSPIISKLWPGDEAASHISGHEEGTQPHANGHAAALTLPLGEVESEGGQTLLFEVVVPGRKPGQYRLAHLLLEYETTDATGARRDTALDLVVTLAEGAVKGPGNPRVMNTVEKATTFKLQTRALQASMAGDVAAATRHLRAAATRLLNMGETELAEATEQEAGRLESEGKMSAAGTKKLVFDTRKLAASELENTRAATVRLEEKA